MICPVGIPNCCLYALWAFPIVTFHIVPHMPCGHQYAPWAYPHGHQYAPWAFPNLPCGRSHSHMPCGHCQQALMPRGPPQCFLFQWRLNLPMLCPVGIPNRCLYVLWAFPILTLHCVPHMPCGHQYTLWVYPHGHQYAPWAFPILPCGHPYSHRPCGHSQKAPMCRGPPFSAKTYPAMICPVGIPNCLLRALWAFTALTVSYWASYALWSSVCLMGFSSLPHICPVGIPITPCGHSQQALMPRGLPQTCLFQRRFTLPLFALGAFPICAYMPGGHSQSLHVPSVPRMPCGIRYALVGLPTRPPIHPVGSPIKPRGYS